MCILYILTIYHIGEYTHIWPRKCTYPVVFSLCNPPMSTAHLLQQSSGGANWLRPKVEHRRQPHKWLVIWCYLLICVVLLKMLTKLCCWQCLVRNNPFWVVKESPVKIETVLSSQTVLRTWLGLSRFCLVTRNRSLQPGPVDVGSAAQTCPTHSSFGATICHSSITTLIFIFGFGNKSNDRNISTPWALRLPVHRLLFNRFRGLLR